MRDSQEHPVFAVVGRVNKGKSSIIATLSEDDQIAISPLPGTTRKCVDLPVKIDGETLFALVDTPGFEQAAAALVWLQSTGPSADKREERIREFVKFFEEKGDFAEECELLRPVLQGACVLYVVDGTKPYRENYKCEMEILRWTGRPSMALINGQPGGKHFETWRTALNQYFKVVRGFDAHTAGFKERIRLLETFRELHEPWRQSLQDAIDALAKEQVRRSAEVVDIVTQLLVDSLTYTLETAEGEQGDPAKLEDEFHELLRRLERDARRKVEVLYNHAGVEWEQEDGIDRPVFGQDLFAKKTWQVLGLSPLQLVATATLGGAAVGGTIDAFTFGSSFLAGTVGGAAVGLGMGVYLLNRRFARAVSAAGVKDRFKRGFAKGKKYRVGPFSHPNFPFVLLDRALLHYGSVRARSHARNAVEGDSPSVTPDVSLTQKFEDKDRKAFSKLFQKIQKNFKKESPAVCQSLHDKIEAVLVEMDRAPQAS